MEPFGERLARYRKARGVSRQQLADAIGVTRAAIALLENGQSKGMEASNLLRAAEFLQVDPEDLQHGELERGPKVVAQRRVRYNASVRDVPVLGYVMANPIEDGYFDDAGPELDAGAEFLPFATRDPNAYALRVRGDSMQPRIRPGELIVVSPSAAVVPGNDVLVRTKSGRKIVKQLLFQRAKEVTLGSINQAHPQITIALDDIESISLVAGIAPASQAVTKE